MFMFVDRMYYRIILQQIKHRYSPLIRRQELFSVECQLLHNALEYQRHTACIQDWQRKRESLDPSTKQRQDLTSPVSHDGHELQLPLIKPHPQLTTGEPQSFSPDSGTDVGSGGGNHDNIVMELEEVSISREEVATLVAEKQRLEARHKRLQRQLQGAKTKMAAVKEVRW